jgi:hypothetical protein
MLLSQLSVGDLFVIDIPGDQPVYQVVVASAVSVNDCIVKKIAYAGADGWVIDIGPNQTIPATTPVVRIVADFFE